LNEADSTPTATPSRAQRIASDSQRERLRRMVEILGEALRGRSPSNMSSSNSAPHSPNEPTSRRLPPPPRVPSQNSSNSADPRRRPVVMDRDRYLDRHRSTADGTANPFHGRTALQDYEDTRREMENAHRDRQARIASNTARTNSARAELHNLQQARRELESARREAENRLAASNNTRSGRQGLQQASRDLENASRQVRMLLDEPVPMISQPSLTAQEYAGEAEANRAIKRRKMDSGSASSSFSGFAPYGRYGQVEPGRLNMEIHSCDGGIFNDERGAKFAAENVLKDDKTVYCTKGNRCNLVLRHQGSTPFTLTELIIKAPPRGYTAP
jgi:hypothetical protein